MAVPVSLPIVLEEVGGQNRVAIFAGTDLPRNGAEASLGGTQRHSVTWYPGSDDPTAQMLGREEDPIAFSGLFQDRKTFPGAAVAFVETLDGMRKAGRLVRFKYGPWVRVCLWAAFRFRPDGLHRIGYSVELMPLGETASYRRAIAGLKVLPDVTRFATLAAGAAQLMGQIARVDAASALVSPIEDVSARFTSTAASFPLLRRMGNPARKNALAGLANEVTGVRRDLRVLYERVSAVPLEPDVLGGTAVDREFGAKTRRREAMIAIREMQIEASRAEDLLARGASDFERFEVYTVRDGETLQRIALDRLGSADRAAEIAADNRMVAWSVEPGSRISIQSRQTPDQTKATR